MTRRRMRWALRAVSALILLPAGFVAIRWAGGNFGAVRPGRVYRAAQPTPAAIARAARAHGVRTVLNLRGSNPDQAWYAAEKKATLDLGAEQIDFPMSSDQWLSREQAGALLDVLDSCRYPLLIHCEWGAERTGLVSAIVQLLSDGSTLEEARREFSPYYLYLPTKDGRVMRGHLDLYADWLAARDRPHTPSAFREWLTASYAPGSPSREHWPCNPYPLKVVSRPESGTVTTWGGKVCR